MNECTKYDGIVKRCKMLLETNMLVREISKELEMEQCLIYRINDAYKIRENVSKYNKYNATLFYELTILNKDLSLTKKDIMFIMHMTLGTLNANLNNYNIMDINSYKNNICEKLIKEGKLKPKQISEILHYSENSIYKIKRRVLATTKDIDKNTIKRCKYMLSNNINMTNAEIADRINISVEQVSFINNKYDIRTYRFRKVISDSSDTIYKLLKKHDHDVKVVQRLTNKAESTIRAVMSKYNMCTKQQLIENRVVLLLEDKTMTMVSIANLLSISSWTVQSINKKYKIR